MMATTFGSVRPQRTARVRFLGRRGFTAGGIGAVLPALNAAETLPAEPDRPAAWRDALYIMLHTLGLAATTMLMVWGLLVLFFLLLGGFSTDGLMHQLDNLASRYVAADAERVASFKEVLLRTQFLLCAAVLFFRRGSIVPAQWRAKHG